MRTVIFGFSRPQKLTFKVYARLIMWADSSNFDHGYVKFRNGWGVDFIYQSSGIRSNFMGGDYFREINVEVEEYEIDLDENTEVEVGRLCVSREGKPYAIKQILGIGLTLLVSAVTLGKIKISNPFSDGDAETDCIEEQAAILSEGLGISVPLDMDSSTPRQFRDWISTLPNVRRIK